jgi:colanic acid biosynthesis glycosyl transferase WcaI
MSTRSRRGRRAFACNAATVRDHVRVLVFSQFFPPEVTAGAVRVQGFADALCAAGHDVTVVCEMPNHPTGVVLPAYRGRLVRRRRAGRLRAWYVAVLTSPVKSTRTRLMFYASYAGMAGAAGLLSRRHDVILASSPPLPVGAAAALVARRQRAPWVLDVRDLWPDAAVAAGELSDPRMLGFAQGLERRLYKAATAITTTTEPFRQDILQRTAPGARVAVLPNGTTRLWLDAGDFEVDRRALGLPEDRFVWAYAGNVGLVQGLEVAIDAAVQLGDDFQLLIVGDGPMRAALEARSRQLPPGRVAWRPLVPPEIAARYLGASDALLVSLAGHPILSSFVPSKLFDYCAVGRPVIVAAGAEPRRLATGAAAGLGVAPGDSDALAAAVRRLRDDPALRERLGTAGRAFATANLRERQNERMCELLEEVAAGG